MEIETLALLLLPLGARQEISHRVTVHLEARQRQLQASTVVAPAQHLVCKDHQLSVVCTVAMRG